MFKSQDNVMLSAIILATQIAVAQPTDTTQRDLAFNIFRDDVYEHYDALVDEYPGLENFWSTDIRGIWLKNTAKSVVRPGEVTGQYTEEDAV